MRLLSLHVPQLRECCTTNNSSIPPKTVSPIFHRNFIAPTTVHFRSKTNRNGFKNKQKQDAVYSHNFPINMPTNGKDPASNQLPEWYQKNKNRQKCSTTTGSGISIVNKDVTITVGPRGPIVQYDYELVEQLAHFGRERIAERVVHAKGAGAFGYFEVTDDITDLTVSKIFSTIGKKTPIAARFSQVVGNLGSADTVRDPRGFAVKFYSEEGIWDLTGNNTPIFFIRDPKLFPMFIHSQKRNPTTNLRDWNALWDFVSLEPQTIHQIMFLFSDRGIPDGHRHMHGFGSHTFSLINEDRKLTWVKFHFRTDQGIKNLSQDEADKLAGQDPDYAVRDLYNAIASKNYPSWTLYIQTMTPEDAEHCDFDPFDVTKVWPKKLYPLKKVGKLVLNRNPTNFFAEMEQLAFSPNNLTPGIGASPDRLLQGRLFSYADTHRYRLGTNFEQIPVNCPFKVCNFQRDGASAINNQGGAPNYHPNSFGGPEVDSKAEKWTAEPPTISGVMTYHNLSDEDNYSQPRDFYNEVLTEDARKRLIESIADVLKFAVENIRNRTIANFDKVDIEFGTKLRQKVREKLAQM